MSLQRSNDTYCSSICLPYKHCAIVGKKAFADATALWCVECGPSTRTVSSAPEFPDNRCSGRFSSKAGASIVTGFSRVLGFVRCLTPVLILLGAKNMQHMISLPFSEVLYYVRELHGNIFFGGVI